MKPALTGQDIQLILTALDYTRLAYEETQYPTNELRREQFDRLDETVKKVRAIRDSLSAD